jgi:deoxyribonuclease V
MTARSSAAWPETPEELERVQWELAAATPDPWAPPPRAPVGVGGVFVATRPAGPREPGPARDRLWAAAVVVEGPRTVAEGVVGGWTAHPYRPGYLALRLGPLLEEAVRALPRLPDVLLVDGTGRDHPRRAGLAVQLGAVLGLPTVGVTDRPLAGRAEDEPGPEPGDFSPLLLGGVVVGAVVRTRSGTRPVIVHAAWRTDVETARDLVGACAGRGRTPEPLRRARFLARVARAADEGRLPGGRRTAPPWERDERTPGTEPAGPRR